MIMTTPCLAAETDSDAVAEIQAMLQKHDNALNEQNLDAVLETYAADPKVVLMGTGPDEIRVGREEIGEAYKHFFEDFEAGSLSVDCPWKMGDAKGEMAWLTAVCQLKDSLEGKEREYFINISASLEKQDGAWRFSTMHMSNLTGGE
jgi:ketosteroid isomerase-like protein